MNPLLGRTTAHFLHIGKTGGSAVWAALNRKSSPQYDVRLHPHDFRLEDVDVGSKVFFFVRDPISRFESGFYSRLRQGQPRRYNPWTPEERLAFERFPSPTELGLALYGKNHEIAAEAMMSIGHVNSSFWDWLGDENQLRQRSDDILFVGRQEKLTTDFERLCQILDIVAQLPDDPVRAHRNPDVVPPLHDEAVARLRSWFHREYVCLEVLSQMQKLDLT